MIIHYSRDLLFINPLLQIPSLLSSPSPKSSIPRYGPKPKSPICTSDETKITWATTPFSLLFLKAFLKMEHNSSNNFFCGMDLNI